MKTKKRNTESWANHNDLLTKCLPPYAVAIFITMATKNVNQPELINIVSPRACDKFRDKMIPLTYLKLKKHENGHSTAVTHRDSGLLTPYGGVRCWG